MDKSDKLIKYLYKNGAKEKYILINDFIKKWTKKEIIEILSILQHQNKIRLESSDFKVDSPNANFETYERVKGVFLTDIGLTYYINNIKDNKIKRFAIYIGAVLSVLNLIAYFPLWISTDKHLDKLEQRIESIEQKQTKEILLGKEELLSTQQGSQTTQKDTLILDNK